MKKCDVCGKETNRTYRMHGYTLCSKHMHQLYKYGRFLDSNPRANNDLNDYYILEEEAHFNVYNQRNEKIGEFTIDKEDIEKVKYKKWRYSHGHVVTGSPSKGEQKDLSHIILDFDPKADSRLVVGYIDGDTSNNKKNNLRFCTQSDNAINKSLMFDNTSSFIGVSYRKKRNRFDPEIRKGNVRCHLGYTKTLEEAVYKRYIAEDIVFGEYANKKEQDRKCKFTECLSQDKKNELYDIVVSKLKAKNLWQ